MSFSRKLGESVRKGLSEDITALKEGTAAIDGVSEVEFASR